MKKYRAFLILFICFLFYFVWNSSWHLPSQLIVQGQVVNPVDGRVAWDSGAGFNDMESADLVFGKPAEAKVRSGFIRIRRIGKSHPAAQSADVLVKAVKRSEDDNLMRLETFSSQEDVEIVAGGYLRLNKDGAVLTVPAGRDHTAIAFATNPNSGSVEIDEDGDKRLYDLYTEQPQDIWKWVKRQKELFGPGDFTVKVNMPRYDIRRLRIEAPEGGIQSFRLTSVVISSAKGEVALPIHGDGLVSSLSFSEIQRNTKQYFHLVTFFQQLIFAALSAFVILSIIRSIRTRGGIKKLFTEQRRYVFWLMFAGGIVFFSAWLLIYWPGHFTIDSMDIWWAAKNPGYFLHNHPFVNVLYYRFLQQFWDHFAVVSIIQIVLTALLGAYIFYFLHRKGVSLYLITPFYLFFITSIPIGLYTITLWKDIPFALLIVFWAFWFVKAIIEKREGGIRYSRNEIIVLSLMLIAVGLFRYNGIVYFAIIPVGLALTGMIAPKKFIIGFFFILMVAAVFVTLIVILDKTHFVTSQSRFFIDRMRGSGIVETMKRMAMQYPTLLDVNIIKKRAIWYDTWYRDSGYTQDHYAYAKKRQYHEWIRYISCEPKSDRLYGFLHPLNIKSLAEPWVYFTWNPFYLLYVFLICFFYRLFPLTAAYGYIVLSQVFILLLVLGTGNYNWRYYYFLMFSLCFLIPVIALDIQCRLPRLRFRNKELMMGLGKGS